MSLLTLVTVVLVVVFVATGAAKVLAVPAMRTAAAHAGLKVSAYRLIGGPELVGAAGLLLGPVGPFIGITAGIGLVLLVVGGLAVHIRNRDSVLAWLPAIAVGALAVPCTTLVWQAAA